MFPVLLQIGPIVVYSLWLFTGIGFLLGVFIFSLLTQQKRLNINFIYDHSVAIFLCGIVGSRLIFILKNLNYYFADYSINSFLSTLFIWDKGLSLFGGILGLVMALIYYSIKKHEQTKKWLDIMTISIIAGLSIGHIGAFLDGSSYGNVTSLPWGVVFDNPSIKYAVPIHPTQIYAFLYCAILAATLIIYYKKQKPASGKTAFIGTVCYFSLVFIEGFLRGDDVFIYGGLREEQWLSIIILIIAGGYLFRMYNVNRNKKEPDNS